MSCQTPYILIQALLAEESLSEKCYFVLNAPVGPTPFAFPSYLKAFLMTCLLEFPFFLWVSRHRPMAERLGSLLLANFATHPIVYFGIPYLLSRIGATQWSFLLIAETFAPITESLLIWKCFKVPARTAFSAMILANLFSWTAGCLLTD